ncbi:MAG: 5-(carboxyamino)imidazole ribonucleotide synthase [Bdellovibrionales bacterium]|nr:5-(carboxyamino)imidazole ribonucleotide synthase [Bdellovibrionales bacterium]
MSQNKTISSLFPGATIGILGGGQLGRMISMEAKRMGFNVHIFDPTPNGPAAQVSDKETNAPFEDANALKAFMRHIDVLTFEFENIATRALRQLNSDHMIFPNLNALEICQNRILEKNFISSLGIQTAPYSEIKSVEDLTAFLDNHSKAIIKTATLGYDGKGQAQIDKTNFSDIWSHFNKNQPCIVEGFVAFDFEASALCARNHSGEFRMFPIAHNIHKDHILDITMVPAHIDDNIIKNIKTLSKAITSGLDYVGVLCIELFIKGNEVFVNELAPRPHNSGHYSLDFAYTSQFEQHVRAICNLPLGNPNLIPGAAAMANLLGDLWHQHSLGCPNWKEALKVNDSKLHLYGKKEPKLKRKMGHISASASSTIQARKIVEEARDNLLKS